jgi:hypothetical protein
MIPIEKFIGRLGSQAFYFAWIRMWCLDHGYDFERLHSTDEFREMLSRHGPLIRSLYGTGIPPRTDHVAVSVRRGDYVGVYVGIFVDLFAQGYYERAMAKFPGRRFLVFSDDISWCRQQAVFAGCEFWDQIDPVTDMNRMAACSDFIVANSGFSWWGAWLGTNPNKRVVCPVRYETARVETCMLPEWERA